MKPRPVRMSDDLWQSLEAEADEQGKSTAEYVRELLRSRDEIQEDSAGDELTVRVDDLERRLEQLEANTSANTPTPSPDTQPVSSDYESVNRRAIELVRDADGHVPTKEIREHVAEDLNIKVDSWWRKHGRDALDESGAEFTRNKGWYLSGGDEGPHAPTDEF